MNDFGPSIADAKRRRSMRSQRIRPPRFLLIVVASVVIVNPSIVSCFLSAGNQISHPGEARCSHWCSSRLGAISSIAVDKNIFSSDNDTASHPNIDRNAQPPSHQEALLFAASPFSPDDSRSHTEEMPPFYANTIPDSTISLRTGRHAYENSLINYKDDSLTIETQSLDEKPILDESILDPEPVPADASPQPRRRWRRFLPIRRRHHDEAPSPPRQNRARQLSSLLAKTAKRGTKTLADRHYAARTITGLINALAEEVQDLDVQVKTHNETPLHQKHIESVSIQFSRLGFKPLRLGGHDASGDKDSAVRNNNGFWRLGSGNETTVSISADEAFDQMDVDNSGYIDREEMVQALSLVAGTKKEESSGNKSHPIFERLAAELFRLYDRNGDGVVDRGEYKSMVDDMALLRKTQFLREMKKEKPTGSSGQNRLGNVMSFVQNATGLMRAAKSKTIASLEATMKRAESDDSILAVHSPEVVGALPKSLGSITFLDVKMDLRRLLFGAIPVVKHIVPGGPLILEPFKATITGSFNRDDIMNSALLDAGLRRLVMRALRKRVGFLRDFTEGSMFRGRSWKTFGGEGGPVVEVPRLSNVEFEADKLIVTGSAKVRTRPGSPVLEQKFKLRTRIGCGGNGRFIRLEMPELALVVECPESWERTARSFCEALEIDPPERPKPLYSFFPIYSPFKLQDDDDGFDLGSDNAITSLYIEQGALRFEMSAVLRPGRFLGSHYIAFTTPIRTLIVTLDRVTEGMRAARKVKKAKKVDVERGRFFSLNKAEDVLLARQEMRAKQPAKPSKVKSFFSRFVDGYLQAERDDSVEKERVTKAIRDFFGLQGRD